MTTQKQKKRKKKYSRNRGGVYIGRCMRRKDRAKMVNKHILINGELVLKPQWKDSEGKELQESNLANLIGEERSRDNRKLERAIRKLFWNFGPHIWKGM